MSATHSLSAVVISSTRAVVAECLLEVYSKAGGVAGDLQVEFTDINYIDVQF